MIHVEAGSFIMGTDHGLIDEGPAHRVSLGSYWLDKTEVTNSMYAACVEASACEAPGQDTYYAAAAFAAHPVVFVSWSDAADYCAWAGRRLPTEAEWEKAATWDAASQTKTAYPWSDGFDCARANFDDEQDLDSFMVPGGPNCDGYVKSSPVGSYLAGASHYGALDLAGNAWEWVHDAFIETDPSAARNLNFYASSPLSDPQGVDPSLTPYRIVRGGSWNLDFGVGRSTYRLWFGKDEKYDGVGFRCAKSE